MGIIRFERRSWIPLFSSESTLDSESGLDRLVVRECPSHQVLDIDHGGRQLVQVLKRM